jgi:hypothetical protein
MRHSSSVASDLLAEIQELTVGTQEFEQRARSLNLFVRSVGATSSGEGLKSIHGEKKAVGEERYSTIGQLEKSAARFSMFALACETLGFKRSAVGQPFITIVEVIYPVTPILVSKLEQSVRTDYSRNGILELVVEKLQRMVVEKKLRRFSQHSLCGVTQEGVCFNVAHVNVKGNFIAYG